MATDCAVSPVLWMTGFAARLGAPALVEHLCATDDPIRRGMLRRGLRQYHRAPEGAELLVLAREAMAQSLARAQLSPSQVDGVYFATASLWHTAGYRSSDFARLMIDAGMPSARLHTTVHPSCHNVALLIEAAVQGASLRGYHTALVVSADVAQPASRVLDRGLAVLSDGAASCVVTRKRGGFRVVAHACFDEHPLVEYEGTPGGYLRRSLSLLAQVKNKCARELARDGIAHGSRLRVVANHYNEEFLSLLIEVFVDWRLDLDILRRNAREHGHVFSGDALIDLEAISDSPDDTPVLALHIGDHAWGLTLLRPELESGAGCAPELT